MSSAAGVALEVQSLVELFPDAGKLVHVRIVPAGVWIAVGDEHWLAGTDGSDIFFG